MLCLKGQRPLLVLPLIRGHGLPSPLPTRGLSLLVRRLHGRRQGRQIEPQKSTRGTKLNALPQRSATIVGTSAHSRSRYAGPSTHPRIVTTGSPTPWSSSRPSNRATKKHKRHKTEMLCLKGQRPLLVLSLIRGHGMPAPLPTRGLSLLVRRLHGRRQGRQIEPQKSTRGTKLKCSVSKVSDHCWYFRSFEVTVCRPLYPPEDCHYWFADSMVVVKAVK